MPNALKPLLRRTALLACSDMKVESLASGLAALGAEIPVFPVMEIREIADKRALAACGKPAEIQPCENTIPSLPEAIGRYFQALPAA